MNKKQLINKLIPPPFKPEGKKILTRSRSWSSHHLLNFSCVSSSAHRGDLTCSFLCAYRLVAQTNWQVFLISVPKGPQQNKQTWLPAPCICRCAPSSSTDGSELSSSSSLRQWTSPSASHTHKHTHKLWLSKCKRNERHNRGKYVGAGGWGFHHHIKKYAVVRGNNSVSYWFWQTVCWMVPMCLCNHTDAAECVQRRSWMIHGEDVWRWCIKSRQSHRLWFLIDAVNFLFVVVTTAKRVVFSLKC